MARDDEYRKEYNAELKERHLKEKYQEYVKNCHYQIGVFVSEFSYEEWLDADQPDGKF